MYEELLVRHSAVGFQLPRLLNRSGIGTSCCVVKPAVNVEGAMEGAILAWACLGDEGLRTLQLPEGIKSVTVFADTDPVGAFNGAAAELALRLKNEGREVKVIFPPLADYGIAGAVRWHDAWMIETGRVRSWIRKWRQHLAEWHENSRIFIR